MHERNIDALAAMGIVAGSGDGRYQPANVVTCGQMALFIDGPSSLPTPPAGSSFVDVPEIYREAVGAMAEAGITSGCNRTGRGTAPGDAVRRDQMASFLDGPCGTGGPPVRPAAGPGRRRRPRRRPERRLSTRSHPQPTARRQPMDHHLRRRLAWLLTAVCMAGGLFVTGVTTAAPASALVSGGVLLCVPPASSPNAAVIGVRGEITADDYAMVQWWYWSPSSQTWLWFTSRSEPGSGWHERNVLGSPMKATDFNARGRHLLRRVVLDYSWQERATRAAG